MLDLPIDWVSKAARKLYIETEIPQTEPVLEMKS